MINIGYMSTGAACFFQEDKGQVQLSSLREILALC
jgi:hypothetical protein